MAFDAVTSRAAGGKEMSWATCFTVAVTVFQKYQISHNEIGKVTRSLNDKDFLTSSPQIYSHLL